MPSFIIKLNDPKTNINYYMEWSTVVDAPVTYGLDLETFKYAYKVKYGENGMEELPKRLERVEEFGCSSLIGDTVDFFMKHNRAGDNEECISKEEILEKYCRKNDWAIK